MLIRIKTVSGSIYTFDRTAMTWERRNDNPGHENILSWEGTPNSSRLYAWPEFKIGQRLLFSIPREDGSPKLLTTTPIVAIELVN